MAEINTLALKASYLWRSMAKAKNIRAASKY